MHDTAAHALIYAGRGIFQPGEKSKERNWASQKKVPPNGNPPHAWSDDCKLKTAMGEKTLLFTKKSRKTDKEKKIYKSDIYRGW